MLKNERKLNYIVGLARIRKLNDLNKIWTGINMIFWPLTHLCLSGVPHDQDTTNNTCVI